MAESSNRIVLQPHLGRVKDNYKNSSNMSGRMSLAKIIKIHHKSNTADVMVIKSRDTVTSSEQREGNLGARIATTTAHFNSGLSSSSGVVEPLQEGQLVILAFLDNDGANPIILGSFHDTTHYTKNILVEDYPLDVINNYEHYLESLKYLRVHPSQLYHRIDTIGGVEVSLPSKTFLKMDIDPEEKIDDSHKGFDHRNLKEKDPFRNYETRFGSTEDALYPVKILFNYRTVFNDDDTTWTKLFINTDGSVRFTRDNNDEKLTFIEQEAEGSIKVRRQLDSNIHNESTDFTEMGVGEEGDFSAIRSIGETKSEVNIDKDGNISISRTLANGEKTTYLISESGEIAMTHHTGSVFKMDNSGDIIINAKRRLITSDGQ